MSLLLSLCLLYWALLTTLQQYVPHLKERLWVPCVLGKGKNCVERPYNSMKPSEVHPRQITASDVVEAIKGLGSRNVASDGVRRHEEFASKHGKGNRFGN